MQKFIIKVMMAVALVGGLTSGSAQAEESDTSITAQMGSPLSSGPYRQLFVYSTNALSQLEYRIVPASNWRRLETRTSPSPDYRVYGSLPFLLAENGQQFMIRGTRNRNRFVLRLTLQITDGRPSISVVDISSTSPREDLEAPAPEAPALQPPVLNNDPQSMAQQLANRMAQLHHRGVLDSGIVHTRMGTLYQGVGWHVDPDTLPPTAVSNDGSAPLADAHAVSSRGTYRVRLYRVATVVPR